MSTFLSAEAQKVLDYLKGRENPFESLVRPQRLDESFRDLHVPDLLKSEREQVLPLIDHFRVDAYHKASDLPASRAVFILGERGAGKTHLLQSLCYSESAFLMVQCAYFDKEIAIEEFLLGQIVACLFEEGEVFQRRPIVDLADALTRRLLRQALLNASPTDRVFLADPGRWQRLWLLVRGGNAIHERGSAFARELAEPRLADSIAERARAFGLSAEMCCRLILGHLHRFENSKDPASIVRRSLYEAMARMALLDEDDFLRRLLLGEHLRQEVGSRMDRTGQILHALIEVCALFRQPIVVAFDNLERLFSPKSQFEPELACAFFRSLAQAIDYTRGILFLIVAEAGLFQQDLSPNIDSFASQRLVQGVPLAGQGPVYEIKLKRPTVQAVHRFVNERMKTALSGAGTNGQLPPLFPFQAEDVQISEGTTLRNILLQLRERYTNRVYGGQPPPIEVPLEETWRAQQSRSEQRFQGSLVALLKDLHAGLGAILQIAPPVRAANWTLHKVEPVVPVGESANYGVVTITEWTGKGSSGESSLRIAIGLLLGTGAGMSADLRAKFDALRSRQHNINGLIIFWPTAKEAESLHEALPEKTRAEWEAARLRTRAHLCRIETGDLRTFATCLAWLNALRDQGEAPTEIHDFLGSKCHGFLDALAQSMAELVSKGTFDEN